LSSLITTRLLALALAGIALISCASGKSGSEIPSNLAGMPVITDPAYYDNPNASVDQSNGQGMDQRIGQPTGQPTDQSADHPLGNLLDPCLSSAILEGAPGVAMLVRTPEDGTWTAARGNIDFRNGIPMKPNSRSRVGSITKMFTAVVILQLMQEGKLSLDDPIAQHLPAEVIRGIQNADTATTAVTGTKAAPRIG
jgi:CubicO group peptidase (beta-lactamase class C family)